MDVITVAKRMNHRINSLETARNELEPVAIKRAQALLEYDKKIALTLIRLKNGEKFILDGAEIYKPAVSISEKIAKGICFQEKFDMEVADAAYKSLRSRMDCLKAELNGYQSINKALEEEP